MRKKITRVFAAAFAALFTAGLGCGDGEEERSAAATPPTLASSGRSGIGKVYSAIGKHRQAIDRAEGRVGILAEKRLYSLLDEELIIRDFFQDRRDGFFLDIGCAWPVKANNTYYLEKHLGWKGIGVDALAEYGPEWKRLRPNSRFFSYLVTDLSGFHQTFYRSPDSGLSSIHKPMASGNAFGAELLPVKVQIETITLNDLLDREGVTKIDLLSMDIEGNEPKALAGFDIERFAPELIVIEQPVPGRGGGAIYRYFEMHGYELIEKYVPFDTVNHYFERRRR